MIRSLRRRHRWMWVALAFALPLLFALALIARPEYPVTEIVPGAARDGARTVGDDLFPNHRVSASLGSGPGGPIVRLERPSGRSLTDPDLLLYWSARGARSAAPEGEASLPTDARLLGPLTTGSATFDLPTADLGELVLYSLGHSRVVARADLALVRGETQR